MWQNAGATFIDEPAVDYRVWRARYGARTGDMRKALDWCFGDEGDATIGVELAISAIGSRGKDFSAPVRGQRSLKQTLDADHRSQALRRIWAKRLKQAAHLDLSLRA
jgi:hypothetical protein